MTGIGIGGTGMITCAKIIVACAATLAADAAAQTFDLAIEQLVSNGVPGPGAGFMEIAGGTDTYLLSVPAPMTLYFDEISGSCNFDWTAQDPDGAQIFFDSAFCSVDPGVIEATRAGTYTITVVGTGLTTGAYSFKVWGVEAPQEFEIGIEELVGLGLPLPGAGLIEEPASIDLYTLELPKGLEIYAAELSGSCAIHWQMRAPSGKVVFNDANLCSVDPGLLVLPETGAYTIEVGATGGATGGYSFMIWQVDPPQEFEIAVEQTVSNGAPAPGAGSIEEPGAIDLYSIALEAGAAYFAHELSGGCAIQWSMTSPSGAEIFFDADMCVIDPEVFTAPESGVYMIEVTSTGGFSGTYSFRIWSVEVPQTFEISLEQTVSNGVPAPGAGNLEEPASIDRYELEAFAGTTVYFQELSGGCGINWKATSPTGVVLFVDANMCVTDPGEKLLTETGTWVIEVFGDPGQFGLYSFLVSVVDPPDVFTIAVGDTVSNGVPKAGAGNLEQAGESDIYLAEAEAGDSICFLELDGPCSIAWSAKASDGSTLFADASICAGTPGTIAIPSSGTVTITVSGPNGGFGTYSFMLRESRVADLNDDCVVDGADLTALLGAWGPCPGCAEDLDGDGAVGGSDITILLGSWG